MKSFSVGTHKIKMKIVDKKVWLFVYGTSDVKKSREAFITDMKTNLSRSVNIIGYHRECFKIALKILNDPRVHYQLIDAEEIVLGGYSLGGAIAKCIYRILYFNNETSHNTYLYGAYPVDNEDEEPNVRRYRLGHDKVPYWRCWKFKNNKITNSLPTTGKRKWPFRFIPDHLGYDFKDFWEDNMEVEK